MWFVKKNKEIFKYFMRHFDKKYKFYLKGTLERMSVINYYCELEQGCVYLIFIYFLIKK